MHDFYYEILKRVNTFHLLKYSTVNSLWSSIIRILIKERLRQHLLYPEDQLLRLKRLSSVLEEKTKPVSTSSKQYKSTIEILGCDVIGFPKFGKFFAHLRTAWFKEYQLETTLIYYSDTEICKEYPIDRYTYCWVLLHSHVYLNLRDDCPILTVSYYPNQPTLPININPHKLSKGSFSVSPLDSSKIVMHIGDQIYEYSYLTLSEPKLLVSGEFLQNAVISNCFCVCPHETSLVDFMNDRCWNLKRFENFQQQMLYFRGRFSLYENVVDILAMPNLILIWLHNRCALFVVVDDQLSFVDWIPQFNKLKDERVFFDHSNSIIFCSAHLYGIKSFNYVDISKLSLNLNHASFCQKMHKVV